MKDPSEKSKNNAIIFRILDLWEKDALVFEASFDIEASFLKA